MAWAAGAYPASPNPTRARQVNSCQKRRTNPPAAVDAVQMATPNVMTLRRDRRSPITPSGSAASDSTTMYAEPSQPSCASDKWRSRFTGSNTAYTTLRSR